MELEGSLEEAGSQKVEKMLFFWLGRCKQPWAKEYQQSLEASIGKEWITPQNIQEEIVLPTFWFSSYNIHQISDF